jgi:pimeloyl-ACP methyl ester carboxylesterase
VAGTAAGEGAAGDRCGRAVLSVGAAAMTAFEQHRLRLWQGKIETQIEVGGDGLPLVFLHGPWGLRDRDLLDRLAPTHRVYAPKHPGTGSGDPDAIHQLDALWDLVVYYGELFDHLGLAAPVLVGHSFGGMVACEIAATMPERVKRLVLIDPLGLWRDDLPVTNWMILPEDRRRPTLFADPDGPAAAHFFALPAETEARAAAQADLIWSQACTGKFVWPIPDRGLKNRIHRVTAPSLIVWGAADAVIAAAYAQEFARRLPAAQTELIDGAGHLPHLEQPDEVARRVNGFLAG